MFSVKVINDILEYLVLQVYTETNNSDWRLQVMWLILNNLSALF